jgi:hypothetical protein
MLHIFSPASYFLSCQGYPIFSPSNSISHPTHHRATSTRSCHALHTVVLFTITTGNSAFAKSLKLSAKAIKHMAKPLPSLALGTGPTGTFFLGHVSLPSTPAPGYRHRLCREPTVGRRPKKVAVNRGLG